MRHNAADLRADARLQLLVAEILMSEHSAGLVIQPAAAAADVLANPAAEVAKLPHAAGDPIADLRAAEVATLRVQHVHERPAQSEQPQSAQRVSGVMLLFILMPPRKDRRAAVPPLAGAFGD